MNHSKKFYCVKVANMLPFKILPEINPLEANQLVDENAKKEDEEDALLEEAIIEMYDKNDDTSKKIIENKLGYNNEGKQIVDNAELAEKLNVDPEVIKQESERLHKFINALLAKKRIDKKAFVKNAYEISDKEKKLKEKQLEQLEKEEKKKKNRELLNVLIKGTMGAGVGAVGGNLALNSPFNGTIGAIAGGGTGVAAAYLQNKLNEFLGYSDPVMHKKIQYMKENVR